MNWDKVAELLEKSHQEQEPLEKAETEEIAKAIKKPKIPNLPKGQGTGALPVGKENKPLKEKETLSPKNWTEKLNAKATHDNRTAEDHIDATSPSPAPFRKSLPDWSDWILQKNNSFNKENKVEKSSSPDLYNNKTHNYASNRPNMSAEHEAAHHKLYTNANSGHSHGEESSGENESDNYTQSAHHYMKTGKALKFRGKDNPVTSTEERKGFNLPKPAGPKAKLP